MKDSKLAFIELVNYKIVTPSLPWAIFSVHCIFSSKDRFLDSSTFFPQLLRFPETSEESHQIGY